ncbi:glycosyltransferase family 4 protein [Paenibacillus alvei]|uniref:Glycosyltransferase n=1 Tax=Paenibacillus alvei TaxID=44250 RepID=A0A383RA14_PAEAL|nr:glycosyltransferase family 4 protein [Paenibacillus alvei]SYX83790.1 conserved protein of unknown function [Paenibacillus alvei]
MRKILVLNYFPTVHPPISGGTIRYFSLYQELSRYYDVTLLSQTDCRKGGVFRYSPTFREYKIEKDPMYEQIREQLHIDANDYEHYLIIHMEAARHSTRYTHHFEQLHGKSDIIIHESPYFVEHDRHLGSDSKLRIYNSHNHEYALANRIWKGRLARNYLSILYELEKKLVLCSDLIFSTSHEERNSFTAMYCADSRKVKLAPNGVTPKAWLTRQRRSTNLYSALFIGSDYPPNLEAATYIVHQLAVLCPHITFLIAGRCCNALSCEMAPNIKLIGRVSHHHKVKLFAKVDLAINPMQTGAGVNLKTLEYLSAGIPLLATHYGVRGLELIDGEHYIHAERNDFADKLLACLRDELILQEISVRGQTHINEHYSWSSIVRNMQEEIERVLR